MTSIEDEDYLFLRLYSMDLDMARHSLGVLDQVVAAEIRYCIHRDIVVTYARPFSGNKGTGKKKHQLQMLMPGIIPEKHQSLHAKLMRFRNQLFAHTDIGAYKPKPMKWEVEDSTTFPMTFWGLDYNVLEEQLAEIRDLAEAVESAINAEIGRIESDF